MQVGDLVRHQVHDGSGIILSIRPFDGKMARVIWTVGCQSRVEELMTRFLEVINEDR